ncbi:HPr family phosphocarrier protein [Garciella nitratireducens]|uniref:Phosphocarrier protein HPr n=1 Tax=Garciella nitratireducens DSM 15102 TaxID=1121911 RepID=A0A1T4M662_9FIRM|nr:HPr family phosphocarrier protein [Garciella nitratireducens]RBP44015.1 phosphocarrier protein [Garciella nitratireducens]SJZ62391.1 phosphocarrier protein [Garciella nitratireducens DSM 15102]
MIQKSVVIENATGLHARPASLFVQKANEFESDIFIIKDENKINVKSILGIMAAGISKGTEITIQADGPDEEAAVKALVQLVENKFGEE